MLLRDKIRRIKPDMMAIHIKVHVPIDSGNQDKTLVLPILVLG